MGPCHVKYVGATPGVDSNVYVLFSTVLSELPARAFATTGVERVELSLLHSSSGTLKWYKSQNRGVTWSQIGQEAVTPVASTDTFREYEVAALADFKLEWTNGGAAQAVWVVDVALDEQRASWTPTSLRSQGLTLWIRSGYGYTLGGTLFAQGTTPPAVTITGSSSGAVALHIEITTGGTLGVALFRWSADGGLSYQQVSQTTAASFVLGATGLTAQFAAGTYSTDNVYDATLSAVADQSPAGNNFAQGSAVRQPVLGYSASGKPFIRCYGDAANPRFLQGPGPMSYVASTVFVVAAKGALVAADNLSVFGFDKYTVWLRSSADNHVGIDMSGTLKPTTYVATSAQAIIEVISRSQTDTDILVNGGSLANVSGAYSAFGQSAIGYGGGGRDTAAETKEISEIIVCSSALSSADAAKVRKYLSAKFGIPVP